MTREKFQGPIIHALVLKPMVTTKKLLVPLHVPKGMNEAGMKKLDLRQLYDLRSIF